MELDHSPDHRFGFVAVIGRPNVGKSTIVNRIVGRGLSIVTPKAQTTRHRITAIHTQSNAQIALVDTPGFHDSRNLLNQSMLSATLSALEQADVVLFVAAPEPEIPQNDLRILELVKLSRTKSVLALNKTDLFELSRVRQIVTDYSMLHAFEEVLLLSAIRGSGMKKLLQDLINLLPVGPPLFPEDDVSDLPLRFFAGEIIREQVIKMTGQEVPHKTAVMIEAFREEEDRIFVQADIHVERVGQKKILIGRRGTMIKQIGIAARTNLEAFLECHVILNLFVKVTPRWTTNPHRLRELGY